MVELLAGVAYGAKELFSYNRENFKFDQDQRIERETLRLEMQVKRFELFREDVRDLVELTVDRMDVYHLVGALFLEFCIVLFCEGRVQASAPPFLLSMFLLSNACAFIYLLLAVWLSMHASIASHSFGVRLLTRFVRLPIPSVKQLMGLRSHLKDYERQSVANLLKLPFVDKKAQDWNTALHVEEDKKPTSPERRESQSYLQVPAGSPAPASSNATPRKPEALSARPVTVGRSTSPSPLPSAPAGSPAVASPRTEEADVGPRSGARFEDDQMLPEEMEDPFGGNELLEGKRGALPQRHIQLFRQLQSKWQCYDAYCRVCMGLGVNQILQGLSYYAICHTLVENHSPTTGYALVVLFQSTTIALAVLDLAGLKRREILAVQVIGVMPCLITALGVAHGARDEAGKLDPEEEYKLSPLSFLFQVLWLELWLRVAAPSDDQAKLPRRFRQVLFLDVFGDAHGWDPTQAEDDMDHGDVMNPFSNGIPDDDQDDDDGRTFDMMAEQASSQLTVAQCAVRRWNAVPLWALSPDQKRQLDAVKEQLNSWGNTIHHELQRYSELRELGAAQIAAFEPELRQWGDLSTTEKEADPFGKCLLGPFEHDGGYEAMIFHYDLESNRTLFEDAVTKECPGALVLTLQAVAAITRDLERDARALLEERITRDLRSELLKRQQAAKARAEERRNNRIGARLLRGRGDGDGPGHAAGATPAPLEKALASFPNLVSLFTKSVTKNRESISNSSDDSRTELIANREERIPSQPSRGRLSVLDDGPGLIPTSDVAQTAQRSSSSTAQPSKPSGKDPTLVAMAGQHARHFVPERLPWQVLSRMTRVLQLCWFFTGVMALLKEAHIYQVDFQEHPGHERRLCAARPWTFERISVEWPHGPLFRPQGLACLQPASNGGRRLLVNSPFAVYSVSAPPEIALPDAPAATEELSTASVILDQPLRLAELARKRLPPSAALLCPGGSAATDFRSEVAKDSWNRSNSSHGASPTSSCLLAAASATGVEVWALADASAAHDRGAQDAKVTLRVEGAAWQSLSGAIVPCSSVQWLLPATEVPKDGALPSRCIALAGWDGEFVLVSAVPLSAELGAQLPAAGTRVLPAFDAPLPPSDAERGVAALHLEPSTLRLWAVLANGEMQAWDLLDLQSLGRWKPRWPAATPGFRLTAICEDIASGSLLATGRSDIAGPQLLRAALPEGLAYGDLALGGFLRA